MLSEVLAAAAPVKRDSKGRPSGITISQLFPCPYRLYKVHMGEYWGDDITPQQYYNMSDGWDQEEQSVRRLASAGVRIIDRQKRVTIGKSKVTGSIDGAYFLRDKRRLWEHKAYDGASNALWVIQTKGFDFLPEQKSQLNGYMLGDGVDEGDFFVKIKNNNDYWDKVYKRDDDFILEIVEWCDKIRLENWAPEPAECKWCSRCGLQCFEEELDFTWIASVTDKEMADKWRQGDKLVKVGTGLKEEARAFFVGQEDKYGNVLSEGIIGDRSLLIVDDPISETSLEIKKVVQNRFDVKKERVLELFGPDGLMQVGEEREIVTYRFREV